MTKSTSMEILTKIFESLSDSSITISEISKRTNIPHKTIKKNLEIIQFIQSKPIVKIIPTGSSYQISLESGSRNTSFIPE